MLADKQQAVVNTDQKNMSNAELLKVADAQKSVDAAKSSS